MSFKKIISVGFLAAILAVFLSSGRAEAGFWNWLKTGSDNQQAATSSLVKQYKLEVNILGVGKITGIGNSNAINCARSKNGKYSGKCNVKFNKGDSVILTSESPNAFIDAVSQKNSVEGSPVSKSPDMPLAPEMSRPEKPPAIASNFVSWGGACKVKKARVCSVVMNGNKNVSAKFKKSEVIPVILPSRPIQTNQVFQQLPFGISNPYGQEDLAVKAELPAILKDLGLSKDENSVAGFVVDEIARRHTETVCDNTTCQKYDFTLAKDLINLVVGQGKANLWVVLGTPSNYKFTDGKIREDGKTYLPDGPISRQAYKNYLTDLVNFVNLYGKEISGDRNWHVVDWNLYNEVSAEYKSTFGNVEEAAANYANFVIDSSEILRRLSPQSGIVLAGAGSGTNLQGNHGDFYKRVFSKIKQVNLDYDPFDYWESHWFGKSKDYKANEKGYGAKDFIKFLRDNGYGDKEFVIRAGGTYSGQNIQERKSLMNNYQSEQDQANFLVKRFIYNLANGVKKIPWSTVYERDRYQGERNVHFQYISLIYDGYPDGVSKNQECVKGLLPCPDPGKEVKKLSYYTFKHLIEKLKGSDWNNIQTIQEKDGMYVYKFNKNGKSIWVAWNDNNSIRQIAISGIRSNQVKITEAIPKYESGKEVSDYHTAFNTAMESVSGGKIILTIGGKPVFVEEK